MRLALLMGAHGKPSKWYGLAPVMRKRRAGNPIPGIIVSEASVACTLYSIEVTNE